MLFQVDSNAATALYRQLVDQVCHAAAAGALKPHDPLPSIRPLARQLHLNRNTVAKAYSELENRGVIKTIPGKGCFIEPVNTPFTPQVRDQLLFAKIDAALVTAHQLQVDSAVFSAKVAERIRVFAGRNSYEPETAGTKAIPPHEASASASIQKKKLQPTHPPAPSAPSAPEPLFAGESETWTPFTD